MWNSRVTAGKHEDGLVQTSTGSWAEQITTTPQQLLLTHLHEQGVEEMLFQLLCSSARLFTGTLSSPARGIPFSPIPPAAKSSPSGQP